ncbi:MAG TPA: sulfotransferase, partial [Gemmataceae bacterium]|nr:sulfotransferase [Gemmataceae bacterium]
MNPFVFLVGCARSGTTLLERIVDAHPQIAVTPELHWITDRFKDGKWMAPEGRVTAELVAALAEQKRFRQLAFSRQEFAGLLDDGQPVAYRTFLNRLFALYRQKKGKPLVGIKTPAFVRRVAALHALWPEAKFIHLIRDGRDVCLSVLNWNHAHLAVGQYSTWSEDPISTTAFWWDRKVRSGRQAGQSLKAELYHEIRYEDLVARPAKTCTSLCEFLGVLYDDAMLRFHEGRTRNEQGLDAKNAWRPITPGLRDWRI